MEEIMNNDVNDTQTETENTTSLKPSRKGRNAAGQWMSRSQRKTDKNRPREVIPVGDESEPEPPNQSGFSRDASHRDIKRAHGSEMGVANFGAATNSAKHTAVNNSHDGLGEKPKAQESKRPPSLPPLCRFFVIRGNCRYGKNCRFSHSLPSGGLLEARKQTPCLYFRQGFCRYGQHCRLRHDPKDLVSVTCGICLENVTDKKFALLSACDHLFCFSCLKKWRATKSSDNMDTRTCPTCRQLSDFIVPCENFCTGDEKKQVIADYRARLARVPCTRFNGRLGSCAFGRDCFYAHLDHDGKDCKSRDKSRRERCQRNHHHDELMEMYAFAMFLELLDELSD